MLVLVLPCRPARCPVTPARTRPRAADWSGPSAVDATGQLEVTTFPDGFLWGAAREWMLGYRPTFGLVAADRQTFARTPKPSLAWLGEVAKRNGPA